METAIAAAIVTLIVNSRLIDIDHVNTTPIYTVGRIIGAAIDACIPCKFTVKFINSAQANVGVTVNLGEYLDIAGGKLTKPILNAYVVKSYYNTDAVGMIPHYIINANSDCK